MPKLGKVGSPPVKQTARRGGRKYLLMTYKLAHAAATDVGNRSMRINGRTAWNEDDYNTAAEALNRLWPHPV